MLVFLLEKKERGGREEGEREERGKKGNKTYRLRARDGLAACFGAHAREGPEGVVCEDVDALWWVVLGIETFCG